MNLELLSILFHYCSYICTIFVIYKHVLVRIEQFFKPTEIFVTPHAQERWNTRGPDSLHLIETFKQTKIHGTVHHQHSWNGHRFIATSNDQTIITYMRY